MTHAAVSDAVEIHFDRVSKVFGDPRTGDLFRAVDDLTLDIVRGDVVAILGKTGCGKSTMFNMLAGLGQPSTGRVLVQGQDPFKNFDFFRGKIAIVFQNDRLLPWRTAVQNVELGLELQDVAVQERRSKAMLWLKRLGLAGHETDYPYQLSGGMRQRVAIARAFATDAGILLCDEPFSALDEITGQKLREEFSSLVRENGKTAVFITHSINEALQLGNRIVVLRRPARIALDIRLEPRLNREQQDDIRAKIQGILAE